MTLSSGDAQDAVEAVLALHFDGDVEEGSRRRLPGCLNVIFCDLRGFTSFSAQWPNIIGPFGEIMVKYRATLTCFWATESRCLERADPPSRPGDGRGPHGD
jgi:hypothetical protein